MSLLDDEDILIADNNPILNEIAKNRTKYLSYGFWFKRILGPAIKQINDGCCNLDIYISHNDLYDFISCCDSLCSKYQLPVRFIDCQNLNSLSDPALFIQHLPLHCIIIFLNPAIMGNYSIKHQIEDVLFNCWKNKKIDVEQLLRDNNAENYIIKGGNQTLYRGNYGIIYLDSDSNKNFNFRTLSGTECYGDFLIPGCNYTFINTCYNDKIVHIKDLIDYGETFLNSKK